MSLQYLEALKSLGASPATKLVIPMEFASLLTGVTNLAARAFGDGQGGATAPPG
jgi:hypothetical protein